MLCVEVTHKVVDFTETVDEQTLFLDVTVLFLLNFQNCALDIRTQLRLHLVRVQALDLSTNSGESFLFFLSNVGFGARCKLVRLSTAEKHRNLLNVSLNLLLIHFLLLSEGGHGALNTFGLRFEILLALRNRHLSLDSHITLAGDRCHLEYLRVVD